MHSQTGTIVVFDRPEGYGFTIICWDDRVYRVVEEPLLGALTGTNVHGMGYVGTHQLPMTIFEVQLVAMQLHRAGKIDDGDMNVIDQRITKLEADGDQVRGNYRIPFKNKDLQQAINQSLHKHSGGWGFQGKATLAQESPDYESVLLPPALPLLIAIEDFEEERGALDFVIVATDGSIFMNYCHDGVTDKRVLRIGGHTYHPSLDAMTQLIVQWEASSQFEFMLPALLELRRNLESHSLYWVENGWTEDQKESDYDH